MSCNTLQDALSAELVLHAKDINTIKQLLDNGAEINYQSTDGWCLLFELISLNAYKSIESLRPHRFNIHLKDAKGRSALFWAIHYKHKAVIQVLLTMGIDMQEKVSDELPSLHYCVYKESTDIVHLLLDTGADIEATDLYGHTALDYAIMYENEVMIKLLTSRGAVLST